MSQTTPCRETETFFADLLTYRITCLQCGRRQPPPMLYVPSRLIIIHIYFFKDSFFCDKDIIFSRNIGLRCVHKPVDRTGSSKKVIICHGHFLRGSSSCLLLIYRHCFTLKTSHSLHCPWNLTFWMWLYHAKGRLLVLKRRLGFIDLLLWPPTWNRKSCRRKWTVIFFLYFSFERLFFEELSYQKLLNSFGP